MAAFSPTDVLGGVPEQTLSLFMSLVVIAREAPKLMLELSGGNLSGFFLRVDLIVDYFYSLVVVFSSRRVSKSILSIMSRSSCSSTNSIKL